jgi:hypothetical protein
MANELPIPEQLQVLMLELHWSRVESGWYASRLIRLKSLEPVAARVGTSAAAVRALADGTMEPTFKQFKQLGEALRMAS